MPKAASATVTVKNEAGAVVYSQQKSFTSGVQNSSGTARRPTAPAAPDSTYTISFDAKDSAGNAVKSAEVTGKVTALDFTPVNPTAADRRHEHLGLVREIGHRGMTGPPSPCRDRPGRIAEDVHLNPVEVSVIA